MNSLSEKSKRAVAALATVSFVAIGANYYGDLGWFGNFALLALTASVVLMYFLLIYLGPHQPIDNETEDRENEP